MVILMNNRQIKLPILFIISAPSGAGKSTLVQKLLEEDHSLRFSISSTTRPIRVGEEDGKDYHFIDKNTFVKKIEAGEFMEYAEVHGNFYGTGWQNVRLAASQGKDALLDIDVQGGTIIRNLIDNKRVPDDLIGIIAVRIFILPPSMDVLEERLRHRSTDSDEVIAKRLKNAEAEIIKGKSYEYTVVNDKIETAVQKLKDIIANTRNKFNPSFPHPSPPCGVKALKISGVMKVL